MQTAWSWILIQVTMSIYSDNNKYLLLTTNDPGNWLYDQQQMANHVNSHWTDVRRGQT